jgi:hypothetical protein
LYFNNLPTGTSRKRLYNLTTDSDLSKLLIECGPKEDLSLEDLFFVVYYVTNEFLLNIGGQQTLRRSNNNNPKFTDCEVMTINIVGQLAGQNSQAAWIRYVRKNYMYLFPDISQRSQYVKRSFRLRNVTCFLQQYLVNKTQSNCGIEYIVDSFPISLCNLQRLKNSSQPFQHDGASFGYCASKKLHYYGYKCHLVTDLRGVPVFLCLTSANMSDLRAFEFVVTQMLQQNIVKTNTIYIGDKGYVGKAFQQYLLQHFGVELLSIQREYNKDLGESPINSLLKKSRKLIETSINVFAKELNASQTNRRSIKGLTCSLIDKLAAFNIASFFNLLLEQPLLRIKSFVY